MDPAYPGASRPVAPASHSEDRMSVSKSDSDSGPRHAQVVDGSAAAKEAALSSSGDAAARAAKSDGVGSDQSEPLQQITPPDDSLHRENGKVEAPSVEPVPPTNATEVDAPIPAVGIAPTPLEVLGTKIDSEPQPKEASDKSTKENIEAPSTDTPGKAAAESGPKPIAEAPDEPQQYHDDGVVSSEAGVDAAVPVVVIQSTDVPTDDATVTAHTEAGPSTQMPVTDQTLDALSISAPSSFTVELSVDEDDHEDDADSALGDITRPSSSVSVSSSIYHFVEEFGRTFHRYKEGKYYLPNDEEEQSRLDLQHSIALKLLDGRLFLAPIGKPQRVLDIGTGTGIWAVEFAEAFPEADVLGTDLSPIQPEYVPPNLHFEIDDCEDDWIFSSKFDYIHGRYMCLFLFDPPKLFRNVYDNLNPGGWVEFMEIIIYWQDVDGSLQGTTLKTWNDMMLEGIRMMGRNALCGLKYKDYMEEAGFVNIVEKKYPLPTNPWPKGRDQKVLGAMQLMNAYQGLPPITLSVFNKAHGWSRERTELFLVDLRNDFRNKNIHSFVTIVITYGQKPT